MSKVLTQQTVKLNSEKKHSVRYDGNGPNSLKGIYVPKALLPRPFPAQIAITLQSDE